MNIDPDALSPADRYRWMISAIVPRPIAWVGTHDGSGDPAGDNLAPFSYFMGVSSDPPILAISVARATPRRGAGPADPPLKHTARNILTTGEFTVSTVSGPDLERMHACSAPIPTSEFDALGIQREPGLRVRAPRPASARFTFECVLHHAMDLGSTHLFLGRAVLFRIGSGAVPPGADPVGLDADIGLDPAALDPVARLGGDAYTRLGEVVHLARARVG